MGERERIGTAEGVGAKGRRSWRGILAVPGFGARLAKGHHRLLPEETAYRRAAAVKQTGRDAGTVDF